jgi:hypothetical protein
MLKKVVTVPEYPSLGLCDVIAEKRAGGPSAEYTLRSRVTGETFQMYVAKTVRDLRAGRDTK